MYVAELYDMDMSLDHDIHLLILHCLIFYSYFLIQEEIGVLKIAGEVQIIL